MNDTFRWEEHKKNKTIQTIVDNSAPEDELYVPMWFQGLMDADEYIIHKMCLECNERITGTVYCDCEPNEDAEYWKCTLCNLKMGNDIRDDYFHITISHPEYLIIGRLANGNR